MLPNTSTSAIAVNGAVRSSAFWRSLSACSASWRVTSDSPGHLGRQDGGVRRELRSDSSSARLTFRCRRRAATPTISACVRVAAAELRRPCRSVQYGAGRDDARGRFRPAS